MARQIYRLNAVKVARERDPGLYADGGGLYLRVSGGLNSGKRWVYIYRRPRDGKRCEMGLGGVLSVPLALARQKAAEARALVGEGKDPLLTKERQRAIPTFGDLADEYVASMASSWRNPKHRAQWEMTLKKYAHPLRALPVDAIETADVEAVLRPLWSRIPETASRLRARIENVLDAAKVRGLRDGQNPAAWRGHLKLVLRPRPKQTRRHHAAMPFEVLPEFMASLMDRQATAARCLEFAILTAARSKEALRARWYEIDLGKKVWTLPPLDPFTNEQRMKGGREHRVPLSVRAIEILREMEAIKDGDFVFPGHRRGEALSTMALAMVLRRMKAGDITVHGFRSSFRDWCGSCTNYPRELAEHALAHVIGDRAEQAYRRDDALERRRPMMEEWATFCELGAMGTPYR